jgi:Flp pilus assembly pilin Flp
MLGQTEPINEAARPRRQKHHGGFSGVTPQLSLTNGSTTQHIGSFLPSRSRRREVKQVLKLFDLFASLRKREEGQTMAEYGVVLAVITIAVFGALALLSGNIVNAVTRVAGYIT